MSFDRASLCPIFDDQINPVPEWKIDIGRTGDMFEETHPKRGQRFVIKIGDAVMRGEETNLLAHTLPRLFRSKRVEVAKRDRDVGRVSEFRCWNGRIFKRAHQRCDLAVAGEIPRSQWTIAPPHLPQAQSKMIAPMIDIMNPAG